MAEFLINIYTNSVRSNLSICLLFFVCCWLLKYNWNRRKLYEVSWALQGPFALPIIGNALNFCGSREEIVTNVLRMAKKYESPVRFWLANKLLIYVAKPEDLEIIFNHKNFIEKSDMYDFAKPGCGNGLVTANGKIWRNHRKILNLTFNRIILNSFVGVLDEQSGIFVENMRNFAGKGKFDIFEYLSLLNIDTTAENLMGVKVRAQERKSELLDWLIGYTNIILLRIIRPWYYFDVVFNLFPISKKFSEYTRKTRSYAASIVKQRRQIYEENLKAATPESELMITKRKALLDCMLENGGTTFTDSDIIDEVLTFMIAASETTATAISLTLMMLGLHHNIQEKVYDELVDIFGNSDRAVVSDDLPKLKYLERVIKESLRIFAVALAIGRTATDDVKLTTCTVPKGATVAIGMLSLHRDPKFWPDPLKFDPDRFLPEEVQKRHPYAYIPFAGGPRNCIGYRYAMMSMKLLLAKFLRTYRVKQDLLVKDIKLEMAIFLKPTKGYNIEIELRNGLKERVK